MKAKVRTFSGTTSNEVTQREIDNRALARKAAAEGFVLLKNEDHFLPAKKGGKIALYGAGAAKTIKGGTGSGDVNERDYVTIAQGMKNAGYEVTTESWLDSYMKIYNQAREDWKAEILKKAETLDSALPFWDAYSATPFFMPCGDGIDVEVQKVMVRTRQCLSLHVSREKIKTVLTKREIILSPQKKKHCWHRYVRVTKMLCW